MAVNRSSISAQAITENIESVIEIRSERPIPSIALDPPDIPGRLIGYYNGADDFVELYVVSGSGLFLLKV